MALRTPPPPPDECPYRPILVIGEIFPGKMKYFMENPEKLCIWFHQGFKFIAHSRVESTRKGEIFPRSQKFRSVFPPAKYTQTVSVGRGGTGHIHQTSPTPSRLTDSVSPDRVDLVEWKVPAEWNLGASQFSLHFTHNCTLVWPA